VGGNMGIITAGQRCRGVATEECERWAWDGPVMGASKELLGTGVRPAVAMDGGDIGCERCEAGIVYLQMHGSCQGCPSSTATLKMGIENMLRHYIPEVTEVRPVV